MTDNYPPGFNISKLDGMDENTPCECKHALYWHNEDTDACEHDDCDCKKFKEMLYFDWGD